MQMVIVTGRNLTLDDVRAVAREQAAVRLDEAALVASQRSRQLVEDRVAAGDVVYGITTGFGQFKSKIISADQTAELQTNLMRSHAIGVGQPFAEEVVRAAMLIRLNSLMVGHSGVRRELLELLVGLLNAKIYPYVPERGSVGASGDLAPLSHLGLLLIGEGEVISAGQRVPAGPILEEKKLTPINLMAKEGLAFNNGTSFMTALAALAVGDALQLTKLADITAALTLEGLNGLEAAFDERIHVLRPYPGQQASAANIRALITASELIQRAGHDRARVQDAYALRCTPQVHGASRQLISFVRSMVEIELNSVTDNPLIFPADGDIVSGGNFHGEPMGMAMDTLKIALAELANISERRSNRLLDPATSEGLPAFLIPNEAAGLSSGYMIAQYTAAALVSEMKVLAHPASVDSIPTCANQEDHVSMGTTAARHARQVVDMVYDVLAIELAIAGQAVEFRPNKPGRGAAAAIMTLRSKIAPLVTDRILYHDQELINHLLRSGQLLKAVEQAVGALQ